MKKLLNLKIATLVLILGYALPTHGMAHFTNQLKNLFSASATSSFAPSNTSTSALSYAERKELHKARYNPETDTTTVVDLCPWDDYSKIRLIAGKYTGDQLIGGHVSGEHEIGVAKVSGDSSLALLTIHPNYRQKGHGKELFAEAQNYCQREGCTSMDWEASVFGTPEKALAQEKLNAWYKKLGGKTTDGRYFSIDLQAKNTKQPSTQFLHF